MTLPASIHDWNAICAEGTPLRKPLLLDETLRDGLQSPSVRDPEISAKRDLLHRLVHLGIDSADLGMPGAGPNAMAAVKALLTEIRDHRLPIEPHSAVRTVEADLMHLAEVQQKVGLPLEAGAFLGSSPIRMEAEGWDLNHLVDLTRKAVVFCRNNQVPVMMVTEDTTRACPEHLSSIYQAAIDEGAQAICLSDTCGHATPDGVRNLVQFVKRDIVRDQSIRIDWHGHNDRGLGVANAIAAFEAGADRIHGSILGIGERAGNVALDQLMVNLTLMGVWKGDLSDLPALAARVAELCGIPVPVNYPILGRDAFRTGTGVHAAAIVKALRHGDVALADAVYSGVPAALVGRRQEIEIGPVAGHSNVVFWLERNGYDVDPERIERILALAKKSHRILTEAEIESAL
jgi:isopropylmalate/homocitrate/citramalate synthase